jgi:hypothetical protein
LPAGNQLELATVVMHHGLGSQQTELLVRLWKNDDPPVRDHLLAHPQAALANLRAGDPEAPSDPRLTPRGQRLERHLRILQGATPWPCGPPKVMKIPTGFSHTSLARIVHGKQPQRPRASSMACESPPQHVAEYLKASGHRRRSMEHYERLLQEKARKPKNQ